MLSMIGLSEALFTVGAAIVTIVPRTSSSSSSWGFTGGDLTAPFRKAVLITVVMNVFRNVCFDDRRFRDTATTDEVTSSMDEYATFIYYSLTSIESFCTTFLLLLMPYLLQCQLSEVINIRPGQDLMPWLSGILFLNVAGIFGALYRPNLWAIKRLGDALGPVPVIKTLQLFRRVNATRGGNTITIKTVETLECYSLFITLAAAAGYLLHDHDYSLGVAVRVSSIFVSWTRVIFHGLLLNVMDETGQNAAGNETPVDMADRDVESAGLVVRKR
jgi:hypothetical protein